jgi:hypothetical protein
MSETRELNSTAEVIDALGGVSAVARITGAKYPAVHNWTKFVVFPAKTYVVMQEALQAIGHVAPASLWGMVQAPATQPDQHRAEAATS